MKFEIIEIRLSNSSEADCKWYGIPAEKVIPDKYQRTTNIIGVPNLIKLIPMAPNSQYIFGESKIFEEVEVDPESIVNPEIQRAYNRLLEVKGSFVWAVLITFDGEDLLPIVRNSHSLLNSQ